MKTANLAISFDGVSKKYKLFENPVDRLKEALHPFKKTYHKDFYALRDVSFSINQGEIIGILGKNGSGKSTLLKVISSVVRPSCGRLEINGKITAMLELGSGFNPDLTGIENIYFYGSLMGLSTSKMKKKVDEIIEFAEVGEFLYQPVRTYSSGMKSRLGFAVSINVEPDILIVDEVLSVGDVYFRQKCLRKMKEFISSKKTILFVTHDTATVKNLCTRAIWLNDGKVYDDGETEEVVKRYVSYMTYGEEYDVTSLEIPSGIRSDKNLNYLPTLNWIDVSQKESFGENGALITHIAFEAKETKDSGLILLGGEDVSLFLKIKTIEKIYDTGIGLVLKDKLGNQIVGINNYIYDIGLDALERNETYCFEVSFKFPKLKNGEYIFTVAISDGTQESHIQHHWVYDALAVTVLNSDSRFSRSSLLILDKSDINIRLENLNKLEKNENILE